MSWINVKDEAAPAQLQALVYCHTMPANPSARGHMAGSVSNPDAGLKVLGTHAAKLPPKPSVETRTVARKSPGRMDVGGSTS